MLKVEVAEVAKSTATFQNALRENADQSADKTLISQQLGAWLCSDQQRSVVCV